MATLPKYHSNIERIAFPLPPRNKASNFDGTRGRRQNTGEHFDRGRFASTISTNIANNFSLLYTQTDRIDGALYTIFGCKKRSEHAKFPRVPFGHTKFFDDIAQMNDRHIIRSPSYCIASARYPTIPGLKAVDIYGIRIT